MIDYEKLNQIIKEEISKKSYKQDLENMDIIIEFADIILQYTPIMTRTENDAPISFQESWENAFSFFKTLNKDYATQLNNIFVTRQEVELIKEKPEEHEKDKETHQRVSMVTPDGKIKITYQETINDSYAIVHEMTHKLSYGKEKNFFQYLLIEVPSYVTEELLTDYFIENKTYPINLIKEYQIEKYQKFVDEAFDYMCEYVLIKLYQTHGIINEELLKKFIQKNQNSGFMKLFTTDLEKILNKIIKENRLDFYVLERYIIGIFLGAILHQEIIKEERKKELLFELISQLDLASDKENLQGLLEQLEIPFIKNNNLYIDVEIAKKLFIAYQKEIANVNLLQDKEMIKR